MLRQIYFGGRKISTSVIGVDKTTSQTSDSSLSLSPRTLGGRLTPLPVGNRATDPSLGTTAIEV